MAGENPQTTLPPTPREPMVNSTGQTSTQWNRWFQQVQRILSFAGGVAWGIINKSDSKLSDLAERAHSMLQDVLAWSSNENTDKVRHISNADGKVWQDHVEVTDGNPHGTDHNMLDAIAELDPTSADTVKDRHLSDAQGKKWEDHVDDDTLDNHSQYLLLAGRTGQCAVTPLILGDATNNTTFEADGTIVFNGAATVWSDINIPINSMANSGATVLDLVTVDSNKFKAFVGTGAVVQQADSSLELLHDWKEDTDITPHIHWIPSDATAGNVKLSLGFRWWNRGDVMPTETVLTSTVATGVQHQSKISTFGPIAGAGKTIGSRFVFRIFRDPADAADTYTGHAIALDFGLHYQKDTAGSRQILDK
jgi:hypothetical protein